MVSFYFIVFLMLHCLGIEGHSVFLFSFTAAGLCLTIYIAVLRPALVPQEKHTKVLVDLSAWEEKLLVQFFMYKYCILHTHP